MVEDRALSQREIDELLYQLPVADGGDPTAIGGLPKRDRALLPGIRNYDFRRPDKFSREQWASLHQLNETFARLLGSAFSSRLRALVTVRLSSVDQGLYEEWQAQVPSRTACYVMSMRPLVGNIVIEMNDDIASEVVDRLLGGSGILIDQAREISDVETALLRSFAGVMRQTLEETWGALTEVRPELQDLGFDAGIIQVAAPTDIVVSSFFEVNIGNHLGALSICMPFTVIEPLGPLLSTQVWFHSGRDRASSDEERAAMAALISHSRIDVGVRLGGVDLPAHSIADLQEGDTIVLDSRPGRPLEVSVGERTRFRGLPGKVGNRLALQITEVVDTDDDVAAALTGAPGVREQMEEGPDAG